MLGLLRRNRLERPAYQLYGCAVAAARAPFFYEALGVPDTVDGRFDLVSLHVYLVVRRLTALPAPGPALSQAVFDAMFADMDVNLREMGVGDLSVGRRNRAMWEAFHGRAAAYQAALADADEAMLMAALGRNIWREGGVVAQAAALARYVRASDAALASQDVVTLRAGVAWFPEAGG